jgi:signal transduction histidine kinase/ActR/RegA family two-component response regulator
MERRILIYAPAGKDALLASKVLDGASMPSFICDSAATVLHELEAGAGAVLVADEGLGADTLKALGRHVATQPAWSDLPILVLTKYGADPVGLEDVLDILGNVTFLERPVRAATLTSAVRSALRARMRQYQVRELDRRKDEFLASLSHELRNPLAPIRSSVEVLKGVYPYDLGVQKVRQVVERQVTYLGRLVDDLLDVARITSGKIVLQRERVPLATIIEHTVEVCRPLLASGGHTIDVSQPSQPVFLNVDCTRLVQSLSNVLGNAIKFSAEPGQIHFRATFENEWITFTIRDFGRGMEPASLSLIFDMFAQSDNMRDQAMGGLGIGLSLAKKFTEMHGGSIYAKSDGLGHGSEFTLTLPVVIDAGEELNQGWRDAVQNEVKASTQRRILVVDDNRDGADMLQMLLEADGFAVAIAYGGSDAVKLALDWRPDTVVMDIGLPDLDGYEVARRIRAQPGGDAVTLIALTGWGDIESRRRTVEAGIDHHLVKPVNPDILRQHLLRTEGKAA